MSRFRCPATYGYLALLRRDSFARPTVDDIRRRLGQARVTVGRIRLLQIELHVAAGLRDAPADDQHASNEYCQEHDFAETICVLTHRLAMRDNYNWPDQWR